MFPFSRSAGSQKKQDMSAPQKNAPNKTHDDLFFWIKTPCRNTAKKINPKYTADILCVVIRIAKRIELKKIDATFSLFFKISR